MTRLTKSDWVNYGLKTLTKNGFASLKADVLAKGLKVSRGSFYWHFNDVAAYHDALLETWTAQSVDLASGLSASLAPKDQLRLLIAAAVQSDHGLERAMRAWGQHKPRVGKQVAQLDDFRIDALTKILSVALDDPAEAARRAKFLYAAAVGLAQLTPTQVNMADADIDALTTLFLTGPN